MASYLRRRTSSSTTADGAGCSAPPAGDVASLPALTEFLASISYSDGVPRQTGTLTVFFEAGRWKCCLNDREQEESGFLTVNELIDLPLAVDLALQEGKVDWRVKQGGRSKGR
jgi:hypothetical protein